MEKFNEFGIKKWQRTLLGWTSCLKETFSNFWKFSIYWHQDFECYEVLSKFNG
jgi:hypothetical protein